MLLPFLLAGCGEPDRVKALDESELAALREKAPEGMVLIPGGLFRMGNPELPDAVPVHEVQVDPFYMDATEVTNAEYAEFVAATGYKTVAERQLTAADFPALDPAVIPKEMLLPGSIVFNPPDKPVSLDYHLQWWEFVKGANWRHPTGPESSIEGLEQHPVVHIAYEDALAYCEWSGKRIPTEAEWEIASRGGKEQLKFLWGNEKNPEGKRVANIWEGAFPYRNLELDGHTTSAPVKSYPPNPFGLYDMAGNVWEWTSDWYHPEGYALPRRKTVNPVGPAEAKSWDPQEPAIKKRVTRGGSFLCNDEYCIRYQAGTRGKGAPDTGLNHSGFRCVLEVGSRK